MNASILLALAAIFLLSACHKAGEIAAPEDIAAGMSKQLVVKRLRQICAECIVNETGDRTVVTGFSPARLGEKRVTVTLDQSAGVILAVGVQYIYDDARSAESAYSALVGVQKSSDWKQAKDGKCISQPVENMENGICLIDDKQSFIVIIWNRVAGFRRTKPA